MDKLLFIFVSIFILSCLMGIMERIKSSYDTTWWSTVIKPKWLVTWLNPHTYLFRNSKSRIISWVFRNPLAGFDDFWHFLKAIFLHYLFFTFWYLYHDGPFLTFVIMCDLSYMVIFEVSLRGLFNKPRKS